MVELSIPRGMRDFGVEEAIVRKEVLEVIEEVFKRFGFSPIETPSIENLSVLNAKATYGEPSSKEIFKIEDEDVALRYDLTVPLARFVAMNKDLPMPFKRYQIANAWRREEPQKMRYREFIQADADIVGSSEVISDAELIALASTALDKLGIEGYKILINDRVVLAKLLEFFGAPKEKEIEAIRIIDKLPKIGEEEVEKQLIGLGVSAESANSLLNFILSDKEGEEKLNWVQANIGLNEEIGKLKNLLKILDAYKLKSEVVLDLSLARGMNYYTSFVWEFVTYDGGKRLPTIVGGGRYDNLLEIFSGVPTPATGISLGLDRILDVMKPKEQRRTYAKVFIAYIGDVVEYTLQVANLLRSAGIYTDINITKRNLAKQLEYANAMKFKYVAIIGESEKSNSKIKLRNMVSGSEELLSLEEAIEVLKGE
ncbi:MAG: histidine--tRNA ligase [Candidatus Micrarchaeia archaeon]|jgi:histidyl-tRNA synthetase